MSTSQSRVSPGKEQSLDADSPTGSPADRTSDESPSRADPSKPAAQSVLERALQILRREMPSVAAGASKPLDPIPARMLNEFIYCPRLFYYESVEGVFVESADTLRGSAIHERVDSGTGAMPAAKPKAEPDGRDSGIANQKAETTDEVIHSRSVQMGSERLGVIAKMDLIEARSTRAAGGAQASEADRNLFSVLEACPVDYKAGAPKEATNDATRTGVNEPEPHQPELWDTDKMQLGLQALILRDNGYTCNEGIIYYRATKQRVRLPITSELEHWILENIAEAKRVVTGPIPPPLVNSLKCVRCSLAPVCLPDETRMLATVERESTVAVPETCRPAVAAAEPPDDKIPSEPARKTPAAQAPRRLMAPRDDTRPLYLNTQGLRVGCKGEVLQIKDKDRLVEEVRLRDLSHVALFGNIQISTQAIQSLCELEIPITYFSMGGWFYGITRGHALKNVFLRMEQFRCARDATVCLSLARQFVHGKIRDHRTMVMRNHLEPPQSAVLKLKRASEDALGAASIDELLGIEGAAATQYFQQFSGMVKVGDDLPAPPERASEKDSQQLTFNFIFANRNRRPPTDPVNAMLSLAYSLLSKDCTLAALAVGFDPYVGFFQMYEQRMGSLITHPLFDYKVSYRRALELQARLLAKALTGETQKYVPLITR